MAVITDQQRKFYETTLQVTKQEISDLKDQIEEELAKVKDRIAELQKLLQRGSVAHTVPGNQIIKPGVRRLAVSVAGAWPHGIVQENELLPL